MSRKVKCVYCGQLVTIRKTKYGNFLSYHLRTKSEPCHGFYKEVITKG